MYPSSSSSSSSSHSLSQAGSGLTRYGSAPGSLLTSTVDAVIGGGGGGSRPYYSGESSESTCKEQTSYHNNQPLGSALLRQKSSPAGFLSNLAPGAGPGGFTITHGGSGSNSQAPPASRLKSQLSFTGHCQDSLENMNNGVLDPWDNSNSIAFSAPPNKRSKNTTDPDLLHCLNAFESQFSLPQTSLEMAAVEKLLHIPEDSVPCKIRAKRGCATHPRSIAERERRTRISGKLKKLQDLVPNMDKQTSYADMLDLAVQHIKGLQTQVQEYTMEEDEVYSVARLLGELVAYRASGTGHMELLAALALLQSHEKSSESYEESMEAPMTQIREAEALHKFAEAAYTGPLLDVGRNPCVFLCAWLYRQGILSPWTRNRRPVLVGDNWWRGHAAAFLKYVNLPPEALRHGRISQVKCEAAYFIVVLHHLQSVVIAIRGTETPEDLITDGLCKECTLSADDLAGLINCNYIHSDIKKNVTSSFPHYGHSGIVEAARELFMQIEGNSEGPDSESYGHLSKLLGVGRECFGYNIRIVGHSLGGAIAALLGLQLYNRYPNLHVYSYGPLPCLDLVVANACSDFVTSIIFGNEFSSRLSIGSIMRLRASAITSLSHNPKADSAMIFRLARRFLYISRYERNKTEAEDESEYHSEAIQEDLNNQIGRSQCETDNKAGSIEQEVQAIKRNLDYRENTHFFGNEDYLNNECEEWSLWSDKRAKDHIIEIDNAEFTNPFAVDARSIDDPVSQFIDTVPNSENPSANDPPEMYLPGFVIHVVLEQKRPQTDLKTSWRQERGKCYRAYIANRESFKDVIVSPSMFLDHLPWRCHDALRKILKAQTAKDQVVEPHIII